MLWIKRNLFLAVGGVVALLLLAAGLWFLLSGIKENDELEEKIHAVKTTLDNLYNSNEPFPSSNNIDIAKKETEKLQEAAAKSKKYFAPVPFDKVTGLAFRTFRDNTIDELRKMALAANTELPTKTYAFSFSVQKDKTDFSPSTYPLVPEQMAEVKAICGLLFESRVARLGNLRRAKVSDEDVRAGGTDYNNLAIETNAQVQVVSSPYEVTFYTYGGELAQIMTAFNKSPFGLVLKALQVEPEDGVKLDAAGQPPAVEQPVTPQPPPRLRRPPFPNARTNVVVPPRPAVAAPLPAVRRPVDRPVILLNEKRLKITVLLYVVKPTR